LHSPNDVLVVLAWLSSIPYVLWPNVPSFEVVRGNPDVLSVPFIPFIRGSFIRGGNGEGLRCENVCRRLLGDPGPPLFPRFGTAVRGADGGLLTERRGVVHRAAAAARGRSASRPARCHSVELRGRSPVRERRREHDTQFRGYPAPRALFGARRAPPPHRPPRAPHH